MHTTTDEAVPCAWCGANATAPPTDSKQIALCRACAAEYRQIVEDERAGWGS
jgi:uncharacterized paraquat-inducible protein A